jgi:DNA-binding NtrC family response regulator
MRLENGQAELSAAWSIRKKLLAVVIPTIVSILAVTGYATHWFSSRYLGQALGRGAMIQAATQAHEVETLLNRGREDLLILARTDPGKLGLREFLAARAGFEGTPYRELAFVCLDPKNQVLLVGTGRNIADIPPQQAALVRNNPLAITSRLAELRPGSVQLAGPIDVFYPPTGQEREGENLSITVFRLTTPQYGPDGLLKGYLVLSLDALAVRNILSLFNSQKSPLPLTPRPAGSRFSFFFDRDGWMLFQSENVQDGNKPLATAMARAGLSGDHGRPGLDAAFKPSGDHAGYWRMVAALQADRVDAEDDAWLSEDDLGAGGQFYQGFAPVNFQSDPARNPVLVGGVAFVDRGRLTTLADFRQYDVMFVITIGSIVAVSLIVFFLSRIITRPIRELTNEVTSILQESRLRVILLPDSDQETSTLKRAMNNLITSLLSQEIKLKQRDVQIKSVEGREKVELVRPGDSAAGRRPIEGVDIVGASPAIAGLASLIRKAAQTDADVLVVGETGTGKELTAEAIHKLSARAGKPFIAVNCGALDENLLLDTLFGHAKGAFSDAKTDRKGAFQAAEGGTLLLDEIGNASPKVQQALLRALSVRKIKPLGTDTEIDFDTRVIAATNLDLTEIVRRGAFREDLYYRLKVIAVPTPPLRSHKEDIPLLAEHFLREAAQITRRDVSLSRGALEKLVQHDWPGNVRELKNCLTRAVALAEHDVLYAEDIRFAEQLLGRDAQPFPAGSAPKQAQPAPEAAGLNRRQRQAWAAIQGRGSVSRQEYQDMVGGDIPPRTAQYDLMDLVKKGLLVRQGKGPATRYYAAV